MKFLISLIILVGVSAQASQLNLSCLAPDGKYTISADISVSPQTKKGTLVTVQRGQRMEMKVIDMGHFGRPVTTAFFTNQAFMDPSVFLGFAVTQKLGNPGKYTGKLMGHREDKTIIDYFEFTFECVKK